jgi:predicted signal transduction protein with EAL and GGDEF domain
VAWLRASRRAAHSDSDLQLLLLVVSVLMVIVPGSVLYSQHRLAQSELRGAYVQLIDALDDSVRANEALEEVRAEADGRSWTDALTGVGNRRRFAQVVETIVGDHLPAVVMLVDVDHFKRVNDSYGHQAGAVRCASGRRPVSRAIRSA